MSHKVLVNPETNRVYTWLFDVVTDKDLDNVLADISNSPKFKPDFDELVDLSFANSFRVSPYAVEDTGRACNALFSTTAKRVIAAPSESAYGIARMFQIHVEKEAGCTVHVVRTKAEAYSLLNLVEHLAPRLEFSLPTQPEEVVSAASGRATISARLRNVTMELWHIQDLLVAEEDVDPSILTDFRDALNRVRNTAWAVEQYLNSKMTETGSKTVISHLAGERVRVTHQLCKLVQGDLDNRAIPFKKGQLIQLRDATQELGTHLDKAVGE